MKKLLSVALVLVMLLTQFAIPSFADVADGDYWYDDPYADLDVESVTITANKPLYKNVSGWYEDIYDENDEISGTMFYYDIDYAEATATVVYENGDVEESYLYDLYDGFESYDDQYEKPWGLGKHTVTVIYRGFETTFEVEVAETPVKSVTAVAQNKLIDGFDGGTEIYIDEDGNAEESTYYYYGRCIPYFTVTMKDGTVVKGDEYEIYEQTGYYVEDNTDQNEKPFVIGKNTVEYTFMGVPCACEIEIISNPYKGVSLKGENEAYLVFEGIDEKDTYETKITEVYFYDWTSEGSYYGVICLENGKEYDVCVSCAVDDGTPIFNKNVSIDIGPFTTNTLEKCNYFKAEYIRELITYSSINYYAVSDMICGKSFNGYNADEPDIDHLVALSTYTGSHYSDAQFSDFGMIYKLTVDECEKNIEEIFGITDVDVKKSEFYNRKLFGGEVVVEYYDNSMYPEEVKMTFQDGKWVITSQIFDYGFEYEYEARTLVGNITIILNEDGTVYSIDIEEIEIEQGDVNCDGEITAVDARLVLQYVAGLVEDYEINMFYADANSDENITAVDARIILQKVAGLIE